MENNTLKSGSLLKRGEYRITGVLGQGGFGITYEAEQVSLGRKVAVKEFFMKDYCDREDGSSHVTLSTSSSSRELVDRFRTKFVREARMIAGLDHDHIVKIIDVFEENGTAYYVMEYLGGGSLDRNIKDNGAMPENVALGFIRQIANALGYLHSQNILHFDVKPSNVLLGKNGSAKLIDFGISKHYDEAGVQTSSTPVGISKGFAPLEQYQQGSDIKSFTPATDIYALGATLYALLSGSNPPEASIVNEDGVPVIEGISPNVMRVIEKAMQPRRKDRPQSVAELLALLDGTAKEDDDEETVVPRTEDKGKNTKSDKEKKPAKSEKPKGPQKQKETKVAEKKPFPKWLYGVLAGVVVAVLAFFLLNRSGKSDVSDLPQIDSTAVVAEAVTETPVMSQPSESVSKPEPSPKPETPAVIELKSIALNKTALELEEGGSATLTVKYSPNDATDKATTWKSSDANVAKVSANGKVMAVKSGNATIIANCQGKDAYCNVTVKAKEVQSQQSASKPETPVVIELKSIALNKTTLELEEGGNTTLTIEYSPNNATDKTTTWKSSDASVAKVSDNGKVTAVKAGNATIIATCQGKIETCAVTVRTSGTGTHAGHEWVDLGLSVKWATCNVGASTPEGYGDYFAWGETSPKSEYTWATLKYCNDASGDSFSKYVTDSKYGPVDNKTRLDLSDDAARANWGGSWRMPTSSEIDELEEKCTWTWTTMNGKAGYRVTSKSNGNSVFLPAAGYSYGTNLTQAGSNGYYWSSSLNAINGFSACSLHFSSGLVDRDYYNRYLGTSVRPVCP